MSKKPRGTEAKADALAAGYKPTAPEQAVMVDYLQRRNEKVVLPNVAVEVDEDGSVKLAIDHPSQATGTLLLMDALGIQDTSVFNGFLQQLVNASALGREPTAAEVNFALKTVIAIGPRDAVEAMLAAQMVAVHQATMTFARRLNHVEMIAQQDSAAKAFTKLSRTYTAQIEALRRYRTGGEQKVTVEHVTVHEGGQAIVGNVSHGGRGDKKGGSTA